ncbi:MAG: anti-sigma factor family protein [Anaerovoracaceae bacterium]|jgi:hypothetical protein
MMMSCNEIRELLSPYIDDLLEEVEVNELCNHLDSCPSCKKVYHELKEMTLLLNQSEPLELPDGFEERIKASIQGAKKEEFNKANKGLGRNNRKIWRMASSIAAIFVVGILSYGVYNEVISPTPDALRGMEQLESAGSIFVEDKALPEAYSDALPGTGLVNREASADEATADMDEALKNESLGAQIQENMDLGDYSLKTKNLTTRVDSLNTTPQPKQVAEPKESALSEISVEGDTKGSSEYSGELFTLRDSALNSVNEDHDYYVEETQPSSYNFPGEDQKLSTNVAAVQLYSQLISEKLASYSYQIVDHHYSLKGEWLFNVFIFMDQDGNTYNEEIQIVGKNGEIFVQSDEKVEL